MFYLLFILQIFSYNEDHNYDAVCKELYNGENKTYYGKMQVPNRHNALGFDKDDYIKFTLTKKFLGFIPQNSISTRLMFFQEKQSLVKDSNFPALCKKDHNLRVVNFFYKSKNEMYCFNISPVSSFSEIENFNSSKLINIRNMLYCLIIDKGSKNSPSNIQVEESNNDYCFKEKGQEGQICLNTLVEKIEKIEKK